MKYMQHLKKNQDIRQVHAFNEWNQDKIKEMIEWCNINCKGHWYILNGMQLCLNDDQDAMFFKLTWCS